jgi:hypothetical protein
MPDLKPETKKEKNITELRDDLSEDLQSHAIIPISYKDEFAGFLIPCGSLPEKQKARLRKEAGFNPTAAINELIGND